MDASYVSSDTDMAVTPPTVDQDTDSASVAAAPIPSQDSSVFMLKRIERALRRQIASKERKALPAGTQALDSIRTPQAWVISETCTPPPWMGTWNTQATETAPIPSKPLRPFIAPSPYPRWNDNFTADEEALEKVRNRVYWRPTDVNNTPFVEYIPHSFVEQRAYASTLYAAMVDLETGYLDRNPIAHMTRPNNLLKGVYDQATIQSRCFEVVEELVSLHTVGSTVVPPEDITLEFYEGNNPRHAVVHFGTHAYKLKPTTSDERHLNFEQRFAEICISVTHSKNFAVDLVEGHKIKQMILAPVHYRQQKHNDAHKNAKLRVGAANMRKNGDARRPTVVNPCAALILPCWAQDPANLAVTSTPLMPARSSQIVIDDALADFVVGLIAESSIDQVRQSWAVTQSKVFPGQRPINLEPTESAQPDIRLDTTKAIQRHPSSKTERQPSITATRSGKVTSTASLRPPTPADSPQPSLDPMLLQWHGANTDPTALDQPSMMVSRTHAVTTGSSRPLQPSYVNATYHHATSKIHDHANRTVPRLGREAHGYPSIDSVNMLPGKHVDDQNRYGRQMDRESDAQSYPINGGFREGKTLPNDSATHAPAHQALNFTTNLFHDVGHASIDGLRNANNDDIYLTHYADNEAVTGDNVTHFSQGRDQWEHINQPNLFSDVNHGDANTWTPNPSAGSMMELDKARESSGPAYQTFFTNNELTGFSTADDKNTDDQCRSDSALHDSGLAMDFTMSNAVGNTMANFNSRRGRRSSSRIRSQESARLRSVQARIEAENGPGSSQMWRSQALDGSKWGQQRGSNSGQPDSASSKKRKNHNGAAQHDQSLTNWIPISTKRMRTRSQTPGF